MNYGTRSFLRAWKMGSMITKSILGKNFVDLIVSLMLLFAVSVGFKLAVGAIW